MKFKQLSIFDEYIPQYVSSNADWIRNVFYFYCGGTTIIFNKEVNIFSKKYLESQMVKLRQPRIKSYYNVI